LARLIQERAVTTLFQPLVSVRRKAVFALEALSRGLDPDTGALISAPDLFGAVATSEQLLALDRLCREKAMEAFAPLYRANKSLILSLNVDGAVVHPGSLGSGHILDLARRTGVNPNNVVIEIIESRAADADSLLSFVRNYAGQGFLIALDDVGAGHSNLDRIPMLKPHILKLDRSLVREVQTHHHKQEVVAALSRLCSRIGAMVLAEGVEQPQEAMCCMGMGVELFQGYFFGRPAAAGPGLFDFNSQAEVLTRQYKIHAVRRINAGKERSARHRSLTRSMVRVLETLAPDAFNPALTGFLDLDSALECVYVLDMEGVQVTDTVCNPAKLKEARRFLYEPARRGADHSMKEYYLPLRAGLPAYTTEPYISLASGNRCITLSLRFADGLGQPRILCVDVTRGADHDCRDCNACSRLAGDHSGAACPAGITD
jgi:EAL domain-containing protein (putative c-di-GMP-specific phosphodiesterase class I)